MPPAKASFGAVAQVQRRDARRQQLVPRRLSPSAAARSPVRLPPGAALIAGAGRMRSWSVWVPTALLCSGSVQRALAVLAGPRPPGDGLRRQAAGFRHTLTVIDALIAARAQEPIAPRDPGDSRTGWGGVKKKKLVRFGRQGWSEP